MNNKTVITIIIIILIAIGLFLFKNKGVAPTEVEVNSNMPAMEGDVIETEVIDEMSGGAMTNIKEFSIDAAPFSFTPSTMTVNKGDTVKITVKNIKGTHDLKLDEFDASTRILNAGEEQTITFVADKTGTFEYYCSVGNHRAQGMVGSLTVQ